MSLNKERTIPYIDLLNAQMKQKSQYPFFNCSLKDVDAEDYSIELRNLSITLSEKKFLCDEQHCYSICYEKKSSSPYCLCKQHTPNKMLKRFYFLSNGEIFISILHFSLGFIYSEYILLLVTVFPLYSGRVFYFAFKY